MTQMVILLYSEAFPYNTRIGINSPACCQLFAVGAYGCMASFLYPADTSERVTLVPIFYFIKIGHPLHFSSSFAKSHAWLTCSVINALTTVRRRYQLFASYKDSILLAGHAKYLFHVVLTVKKQFALLCGLFFLSAQK